MHRSKFTLRDFDPTPPSAPHRRYNWRKGSIQPFSSLWITVLRFALLNRPKFDSLNEDLQGHEAARLRRVIKFGSDLPWTRHTTINVRVFAQMLDEPLAAFRWSSVGDFPYGIQHHFYRETRICPSCIAQGFHTVIFSATFIQRCPYHGDILTHTCPDCGDWLDDRSKTRTGIPRICRCDRAWLSLRLARNPPPDTGRDEAMREVVNWAEDVSEKYWIYLPARRTAGHLFQLNTLEHHIERWRIELGQQVPAWLSLRLTETPTDPLQVRHVERSGFKLASLARLPKTGTAFFSTTLPVMEKERRLAPVRVFKCIRRYLVNHVLGNRVGLIVWVGNNLSAPDFRRRMSAEPYVLVAWAVLRWMQCSDWVVSGAKAWFRALHGVSMFPRWVDDPTKHWMRSIQDQVLFHRGGEIEAWIVNWLNASAMLDVWPTNEDMRCHATDEGFLWPKGLVQRLPIRWWAWLDENGRLALGTYRRRPIGWEPARRRSKEERRTVSEKIRVEQLQALRDAMSAQVIRWHDDGSWRVEGRREFPLGADLRRARLSTGMGRASSVGVGLDPRSVADPEAPWYVRSLDYPVCVTSADIKSGIHKLKSAVRAYMKNLSSHKDAHQEHRDGTVDQS